MGANQNKGPQPQYLSTTVAQGVETKADPNLVQSPKGLQADNVRLTTIGAMRKRYGMSVLPAPTSTSANTQVASTSKQLIALQTNQLYAFDQNAQSWISPSVLHGSGSVAANDLNETSLGTISTANSPVYEPTVAVSGSIGVYAYGTGVPGQMGLNVVLTCFDVSTGQTFWNTYITQSVRATGPAGYQQINGTGSHPTAVNFLGATHPRLSVNNNQFLFTFIEREIPSGGTADCFRAFSFTPSRTVKPNFYTGANVTQLDNFAFPTYWVNGAATYQYQPYLYASTSANSNGLIIALNGMNKSDTTSQVVVLQTSSTTLTQTTPFTTLSKTLTGVTTSTLSSIAAAPGIVALNSTYFTAGTTLGTSFNYGLASNLKAPFDVQYTSAGNFTVSDGTQVFNVVASSSTTSVLSLAMVSSVSLALASKIVTYNGAPCAWIYSQAQAPSTVSSPSLYSSLLFVNLLTSDVLARALYLQTEPVQNQTRPTNVFMLNGAPTTILFSAPEDAVDPVVFAELVSVIPAQNQAIRTPDGAIITGADTKYYDNNFVRSAGWLKIPELDSTPLQGTSGGGLQAGFPYSYIAVLVDYDSAGNAIYSSPSPAYSITLTTGQNAVQANTSTIWPNFFPSSTGPALQLYRNSYYDPLNYYLAQSYYLTEGTTNNIIDVSYDQQSSNINGNAQLYSQPDGGELPNDPAPPSTCGVATKTRIFLGSSERRSALYFSKPIFYGRAPEFNYGNVLDIEPSSGAIVGLGALDESVIIFKTSYIYILSGQGPDATGSGTFSAITNISTDRGLVDRNSIALSNDGLYFRSQRGIELLDRSYNINYIGASVEGLLAGRTVVSALSVPKESQIRFALDNGTVLVYDYTVQGWTTYDYQLTSVPAPSAATTSQTLFQNVPYSAVNNSSLGLVYAENTSSFLDETNLYPFTVQTAHTPLTGPQGWGRIRRANILGVNASLPAQLSVTFVYDYGKTSSSPIVYNLSTTGAYNVRVRAPRQVAEAVSIIVQASTSSGTGEGAYITGIMLETSQKSAALRVSDSESV